MKNNGFFNVRNAIIAFVFFMAMLLIINGSPFGLARLVEITGGQSILDMEMLRGYSVDRAYEILDALGEEGRAFERKYIIPLDFPFPLAYGFFYLITLTLLVTGTGVNINKPWLVGIIGVCAALFDWLENFMIIRLLQSYPERLPGTVKLASIFTQMKSLFTMTSMFLIAVGLLVVIIKAISSGTLSRTNWRRTR